MTSMPASRRAAATTLAPRSWPSRPGFATRTRMGRMARKLAAASLTRQLTLARHEEHLTRPAREWPVAESIICFVHDEPCVETELCEARRGVEPDAMLPRP